MVNAETGEASDLEDPLAGYSLFPFSLSNPLTNPSFESLLSNLKNMVVRNPDSLLKQARAIKDGSMDNLESDKTMATISEDKSVAPLTVNDKNPRVRPGLGLKPAKFTLKPLPSQPTGSQDFSIDVTKYEDPEELFRDFERMENARKEMLKLNGQPYKEIDLVDSSFVRRPRRPGLSVKPATYRHRTYSLTIPNNDEDRILSQKANDHSVTSPTREDTIPETNAVNFSPKPRAFDVKPAMSSKPSELDELLSYDYDGLDEDGVQKLLQEKLNIKLVDISNLPRPEMLDIRRRASFVKALPNMKDSIFHDNSKAASSKPRNFSYQFRKTSDNHVSPSRSKSPLASISTLNEQISRLNQLKDPFLLTDFDSSPEVICYPSGQNSKQADEARKRIDSHEAATSPPGMAGISHSDQLLTTNDSLEIRISPTCDKEDIGVSGEKWPSVMESDLSSRDDYEENLNEIRQLAQTNTMETMFEIRSPTYGEENLAVFGKGSFTGASKDVVSANVPIEEVQIAAGREPVGKEVFNEGSSMEKTSVDGGDGEMGVPLNTQGNLIEEPNKKRARSLKSKRKEPEESTTMPSDNVCDENVTKGKKGKEKSNEAGLNDSKNKKRKVRGAPPLPNKVDGQLRKHSLSGDGTKWESGVRRSTRIRMRPLEFWRGERFLYGRVHESMVSVIGVKYASPAKDSEARAMKVKSYVSDEYKELIDLASSY